IVSLLCVLAVAAATSCSKLEGWGLVLWPPEGSAIEYGAVVPVHFKSNITRTYAVGVAESDAKEELELWRLELYSNRKKAEAAATSYGELLPLFGVSSRDGLLLREKPDNVSDQVYRLRLGQPVKLLRKVDGALVETGGVPLEGSWYLALADDGTSGYVFSNQLELWNALEGPMPDLRAEAPATDSSLSALFDTTWRPDYFDTMIASGLLDLYAYQPRYGLFADPMRKQIRVERPDFSKVYRYDTIERREDGSYLVQPGNATFYFTKAGALVFTPQEADVSASVIARVKDERGDDAVISFGFVRHDKDVHNEVAAEERRRLSRLSAFVAGGERFESEAYGVLIITRSTRFTWVAYGALTPDIIPEGSGETGSISMDLYLSPELAGSWQGAFSLRFDGGELPVVRFAYRLEGDDLVLAHLTPQLIHNAVVSAPGGLEPVATFTRYK
ncbi:MAG: SH3 domain-containing protein, partial [Spirochaetales bacterium]|nr:SH3 domain-containing protein [Spirochaetales bacterium]